MEDNPRKPRDLVKNRHSDSLKKSPLTLSQGMMKKGDIVDDAYDDDEVRTSDSQTIRQQHCVPMDSSSGHSIYSSILYVRYSAPLISAEV